MQLTSGLYLAFLFAVFFVYWSLAARAGWRVACLVGAFAVFYSSAGLPPLLLLLSLAAIDFAVTHGLLRCTRPAARRALLLVSVGADLGVLLAFKLRPGALPAPPGLSFFVFQSLAFVLDVYRRDALPAARYLDHVAFTAFFPSLLAGPILRSRDLLRQLRAPVTLDAAAGSQALFLLASGFCKKVLIADYLAENLVDRVFDFPERFSALEVLVAVYGYALQIHADFSGYTDVARGSALLLGFRLPQNFRAPYQAASLPEFWRRWHISLSSFLRDYVYVPLAGRSLGGPRPCAALVLTMLLGGLWHGDGWTFAAWGLLHGLGLVVARLWQRRSGRRGGRSMWGTALTFHAVCLGWVLFRADSLAQAWAVLSQLAGLTLSAENLGTPVLLVVAVAGLAHALPEHFWEGLELRLGSLPAPAQAALLVALGFGLRQVATSALQPFIYTRF